MATKVIFDGDVEFTSQSQWSTAVSCIVKTPYSPTNFFGNELTFVIEDTTYICKYNELRMFWYKALPTDRTPGKYSINVFPFSEKEKNDSFMLQVSAEFAGQKHVRLVGEYSETPITYSATQNGGSIYDNLVELYNSVTGEDPKGHNPSEVIDELKGKLGAGGTELVFNMSEDGVTCDRTVAEAVAIAKNSSITSVIIHQDGMTIRLPVLTFSAATDEAVDICVVDYIVNASIDCSVISGEIIDDEDTWTYSSKRILLEEAN